MDLNKLKNNPEKVEELISLLQSLIGEEAEEEQPVAKKKTTRRSRRGSKAKSETVLNTAPSQEEE